MTTLLEAEASIAYAHTEADLIVQRAREAVTADFREIINATIPELPGYHKLDPNELILDMFVQGTGKGHRVYFTIGNDGSSEQMSLPASIFESDDPLYAAIAHRQAREDFVVASNREEKLKQLAALKAELGVD